METPTNGIEQTPASNPPTIVVPFGRDIVRNGDISATWLQLEYIKILWSLAKWSFQTKAALTMSNNHTN